jgi:hypothetical protein
LRTDPARPGPREEHEHRQHGPLDSPPPDPLRPRGGASHDSSLRAINPAAADLPDPIAKALTSPYAWQRLNQLAAAAGYQTLRDAAEHLGIAQPTLVAQINRLERDIGGRLLERAERGRPMTLTDLGKQVLAVLRRTQLPDDQM